MYATSITGCLGTISQTKETKVLQQLIIWNTVAGAIIQDITTTTVKYVGLDKDTAEELTVSSETSGEHNYLGSAVLTSSGGAFIRCVSCWGTKVVSSCSRMGDSNCYEVTQTTTDYTVRGTGQGTTLTLE